MLKLICNKSGQIKILTIFLFKWQLSWNCDCLKELAQINNIGAKWHTYHIWFKACNGFYFVCSQVHKIFVILITNKHCAYETLPQELKNKLLKMQQGIQENISLELNSQKIKITLLVELKIHN